MLSVAEALKVVLANVVPLPAVATPLGPEALGLVLAENVASDLDMPPFDKAMMDGFAIRCADLHEGRAELSITEEIPAGTMPTRPVTAGQAARIMTGAPVPDGADAVVMIERCQILGDKVRVEDPRARPRLNILDRAKEMHLGETILHSGTRLRPQEFGLLASVGRASALLHPAPRVAVLSTGDEIVPPSVLPGPGQIRNSNAAMLLAQTRRAGGVPIALGIARDNAAQLRTLIADGLKHDVLILSGGVSAGKLDLVPDVLKSLGVEALFHKVLMKPGKPLLFGIAPASLRRQPGEASQGLIFGLPGNPVSSMVCFELFVRPALRALMGLTPGPAWVAATLSNDHAYRTDRPTYHPVQLELTANGWNVTIVPWFGSPDLRGVASANAFALLGEGDHRYRAGQSLDVLRMEAFD